MQNWTSLVAQMVKRLPAMQESWVRSLGWEDPLEKGMATHSSTLAWEIPGNPMDKATVHVVPKSRTRLRDFIIIFNGIMTFYFINVMLKVSFFLF